MTNEIERALKSGVVITSLREISADMVFYIVRFHASWSDKPTLVFSGVFWAGYERSWDATNSVPVQFDGEATLVTRTPTGLSIARPADSTTYCLSSLAPEGGRMVLADCRTVAAKKHRPIPWLL